MDTDPFSSPTRAFPHRKPLPEDLKPRIRGRRYSDIANEVKWQMHREELVARILGEEEFTVGDIYNIMLRGGKQPKERCIPCPYADRIERGMPSKDKLERKRDGACLYRMNYSLGQMIKLIDYKGRIDY